jgi:hypothetical protein
MTPAAFQASEFERRKSIRSMAEIFAVQQMWEDEAMRLQPRHGAEAP